MLILILLYNVYLSMVICIYHCNSLRYIIIIARNAALCLMLTVVVALCFSVELPKPYLQKIVAVAVEVIADTIISLFTRTGGLIRGLYDGDCHKQ